jgi:hypothetical protein
MPARSRAPSRSSISSTSARNDAPALRSGRARPPRARSAGRSRRRCGDRHRPSRRAAPAWSGGAHTEGGAL